MKTIAIIELSRQFNREKAALEARVKELEALSEELRADSHEAAKVAGTNAARAQKAEAELARLKAQEPVAWRYRRVIPHMRNPDGTMGWKLPWKLTEDKDCVNRSKEYEMVPLYAEPRPAVLPPEIIALIEILKPEYGAPGSRDIDVTAKRNAVDKAVADALATGCQPQRFVVKMKSSYALLEKYPTLALHDLIAAIRAAGGEIVE